VTVRTGAAHVLGESLYEYDLELCDYAVGNIRQHCIEGKYIRLLKKAISQPVFFE
jgi:hypothetical protein